MGKLEGRYLQLIWVLMVRTGQRGEVDSALNGTELYS